MTSPYSSGGGGTHLEAKVVAFYLAATFCEVPARGLLGQFAVKVHTQRAAFGDPLDDIIISGKRDDGAETQLHIQIKNKLAFTEKDNEWPDVVRRAWDTFSQPTFDSARHRVGVGIGVFNAKVEQHYQSVFSWAENSSDAAHFLERVTQGDYSHKDRQVFVSTIRSILTAHVKREVTDNELWNLLKSFVIIHFDFQSVESSRDELIAIDRLRGHLPVEQRNQAGQIWDHLITKCGELIPVGGGATRGTLLNAVSQAGFTVSPLPSLIGNIQAIQRESERALGDIRANIHGLELHRAKAYEDVKTALGEARFVQIDGEPGTGKSALLKSIARECCRSGPIFVLKDSRVQPKGWSAHAHTLGVSDDLPVLLREFGCAGMPILFIDGIDKITDPAIQLTINDVFRTIAHTPDLAAWRIVATVREQNLQHLETWLDPDALRKLPLRTVAVPPLGEDELAIVASKFPRLRPLIGQPGGADIVLQRPFFLNALLGLAGNDTSQSLPATEVELLKLWWKMGGADRTEFARAQYRRNLLMQAATVLAEAPNQPIGIASLEPEALEELKSAGVLRDKEFGHTVIFAHDIYEEWALCELLVGKQAVLATFLQQKLEPDIFIRPVQLLGSYSLESSSSGDDWRQLFELTGASELRPVWQRAILTSCVQSPRTTVLLPKLSDFLLENDCERLRKLLLAIGTTEVLPNPIFLNEQLTPTIDSDERAKFAYLTAVPKPLTWVRFLDWLVPQTKTFPQSLIPELLKIFKVWQDSYAGKHIRHCREIGEISYEWLREVEAAYHPANFNAYRQPFGGAVSRDDDIEDKLRAVFLMSAGDVPDLVSEYLKTHSADHKHVHIFRGDILKNSTTLARYLPTELVNFVLSAFIEDPDKEPGPFGYSHHRFDSLGISDHHAFYPASPVQGPFLPLLRLHEKEGLRLIHGLCNHSVAIWRKAQREQRHSSPLTPVPIDLNFPWGQQQFWGNHQVYTWFRGTWGNDAVESGLMALEQWALQQIDSGKSIEEICQKVIQGNDTVAVLGIAISLLLSKPGSALEIAFPLITCTRLWEWDIARVVHDMTPTNMMGNWFSDKHLLTAVKELNNKIDRKQDIRRIVPFFVFSGDKKLVARFAKCVRQFPKQPPINYEEEKQDKGHIAGLRKRMVHFSEQADPKYWKSGPTLDGKYIQFWNEPPSEKKKEVVAHHQQLALFQEYMAIGVWAHKIMDEGALSDTFQIDQVLLKARHWDSEDLFETPMETYEERQKTGAVAGIAFVVARYGSAEVWTDEVATWCIDVFTRAATSIESPDEVFVRGAYRIMHPPTFAAHGYAALMARGIYVELCQNGLFSLATDTVRTTQLAVAVSAKYYAEQYPQFYWILLHLLFTQCVMSRDQIPDDHMWVWDENEAADKVDFIRQAEEFLSAKHSPVLPDIPAPWVKSDLPFRAGRKAKEYVRNENVFLWDFAEKILPAIQLKPILENATVRPLFLGFVSRLLQYTFDEILPPYADSKRDREGSAPYEWIFAFSSWCGRLCAHISHEEAQTIILSPLLKQKPYTSVQVMRSLMLSFMLEAFIRREDIRPDDLRSWDVMTVWLFASPMWKGHEKSDHLDREFIVCALTSLFCATPDFSPLVCGIDPGWPHLTKFLPTIEHAVSEFGLNETLYLGVITFLKRGGMDLLPDPALPWLLKVVLQKKGNRKFWDANGEITVELLNQVISQKSALLTNDHRKSIIELADILVDDGVRGAGFLQQELMRSSR